MSAVSSSVRSSQEFSAFLSPIVILNILLVCLCATGLGYYIAFVNSNASSQYRISSLRSQVAHLSENQSALSAEKSAVENPISAGVFAQSRRMVEAKDILYVFENGKVALQR